tara:strand:- start:162 stop:605 length:444 start_codon:yes stop_codon:yes gene_type:complete
MQDIYDLLTGVKLEDLTTTQLDTAAGRTFIDRDSNDFWMGVLTLSTMIGKSRTYSHGLVIPESGKAETQTISDGSTADFQPQGTEIWRVQAINFDSCTALLRSGAGAVDITSIPSGGLFLTNTQFLTFSNGTGSDKDPVLMILKVSL